MSRYIDILNRGREILKFCEIEDFDTDAWLLFEYVFEMNRTSYFLHQLDENHNISLENKYIELIKARCSRLPLQHITGHQEFMGFDFFVNENTLIPRQDTEILAEKALEYIRKYMDLKSANSDNTGVSIMDMCTGTGCIGIAIAKLLPNIRVTGADVSDKALEVAEKNRKNLSADNISFVKSDIFDNIDSNIKYDFIISNPPYIKTGDIKNLMEEVRLHEPFIALDGSEDGLYFYRKITGEAGKRLKEGGYLMYETGCDQAQEVSSIMKDAGFCNIKVFKDLAGHDRVVTGRLHH